MFLLFQFKTYLYGKLEEKSMVEKKKQALKKKKKKRKGKETVQINTTWKKSSNLLKLTLFKMCCVYSFFLKKATVCSENMEKHDIYIYIYISS